MPLLLPPERAKRTPTLHPLSPLLLSLATPLADRQASHRDNHPHARPSKHVPLVNRVEGRHLNPAVTPHASLLDNHPDIPPCNPPRCLRPLSTRRSTPATNQLRSPPLNPAETTPPIPPTPPVPPPPPPPPSPLTPSSPCGNIPVEGGGGGGRRSVLFSNHNACLLWATSTHSLHDRSSWLCPAHHKDVL